MTIHTYQKIKLATVFITAFVFSSSIVREDYIIPVITLALSSAVLFYVRSKVTDVIADERDYEIGGRSALYAMQIFSWVGVIIMFVLYSLRATNPVYEPVAMTLAFSVTFLMLCYSLIFRYHEKYALGTKRLFFLVTIVIVLLVALVAGIRLLSGEDDWICTNGEWVRHGNPSFPAPSVPCE